MTHNDFVIEDELKKLPAKPGVYLMHGENDEIIYVGKAIKLSNRVRSYFRKNNKSAKTESMVSHIRRFEYIVTDSEIEALILECNLIKEHRPKYNIMLMDDKAYPYIRVTVSEDFPRVMLARRIGSDRNVNRYFGPYTSNTAVKETIDILHKLYKIRTCNRAISACEFSTNRAMPVEKVNSNPPVYGDDATNRTMRADSFNASSPLYGDEVNDARDSAPGHMACGKRECLNYHIGQCSAPCIGLISQEEYHTNINKALEFLEGKYDPVIEELTSKMNELSDKMEFEEAIRYRDLIGSVEHIAQKQKITDTSFKDRDIIGIALGDRDAVVQVFFIRSGKMIGRDHFYLNRPSYESESAILAEFIKQFYGGTPYIPAEIMLPLSLKNASETEKLLSELRGRSVHLIVPVKGKKEKLVELASKNARMVLDKDGERLLREKNRTVYAVSEIGDMIGVRNIVRVEAYDISHTGGVNTVGSMIVYENGKPRYSDYRKFNIDDLKGPDDYAALREVLTRRFLHGMNDISQAKTSGFARMPDLIMMDGGKGQVNIALEVLSELGIDIPVTGLVKDDHHRTRGLYYNNTELPIDKNSEGFKLITRIQDEAHRFAIQSHKLRRGKEQVHSVLDDIKGIGPVRRKALRREFGDIENIRNASYERLCAVPELSESQALTVYKFFNSDSKA